MSTRYNRLLFDDWLKSQITRYPASLMIRFLNKRRYPLQAYSNAFFDNPFCCSPKEEYKISISSFRDLSLEIPNNLIVGGRKVFFSFCSCTGIQEILNNANNKQ